MIADRALLLLCSYEVLLGLISPKMGYFRITSSHFSRLHRNFFRHYDCNSRATNNSILLAFTHSSSASNLPYNVIRNYTSGSPEAKPIQSEKVSAIVDEISGLTLLEVADLSDVLREKLGITEMPVMAVMMPGMGFGGFKGSAKGAAGSKGGEEKKAEKTAFDVKLEAFDAAAKIKVIKEVRSFTDLGLKEAKDLVEKAPTLLKKGVTKEEAESIIAKMKAVGANVVME